MFNGVLQKLFRFYTFSTDLYTEYHCPCLVLNNYAKELDELSSGSAVAIRYLIRVHQGDC